MTTTRLKTSELTGAALDWAVGKCAGIAVVIFGSGAGASLAYVPRRRYRQYNPSTDWAQGGPIIEREGIRLCMADNGEWDAELCEFDILERGPTPLIAAMRCLVASKLGEEVEVPDELTN